MCQDLANPADVAARDPELGLRRQRTSARARRRTVASIVVAALVAGLGLLVWASARSPAPAPVPNAVERR
jgi:hypothetical protein